MEVRVWKRGLAVHCKALNPLALLRGNNGALELHCPDEKYAAQ